MVRRPVTGVERGAGRICLDFANTVDGRPVARADRLERYADLLTWARGAGLLTGARERALATEARRRPAAATSVMRRAVLLSEALYRVVAAVAARRPARSTDLEAINAAAGEALARARLVPQRGGFGWQWTGERQALGSVLWPIARSAVEVLTSAELDAVRECAAPGCGRLFLDASRNRSRRWCDMAVCGNRTKVRRYYARRRSTRVRSAGGNS